MCLLQADGKASFLQFLSSVVGLFHKPLTLSPHQRSRRLQKEGGKEGRKKKVHVLEGVKAKRKLKPVSGRAQAVQRPFPVLLETFGYLH